MQRPGKKSGGGGNGSAAPRGGRAGSGGLCLPRFARAGLQIKGFDCLAQIVYAFGANEKDVVFLNCPKHFLVQKHVSIVTQVPGAQAAIIGAIQSRQDPVVVRSLK